MPIAIPKHFSSNVGDTEPHEQGIQ